MRRRSFLWAAGAAIGAAPWEICAQSSLGTLAWVQMGGLWVRELPDGREARIASGARLQEPRFSPSGQWLAYRAPNNRVFVARGDGQAGGSFEGEAALWLPGEDRLALQTGRDVTVFGPGDGWKAAAAVWKDAGLGPFSPDKRQYAAERIHEMPKDRSRLNRDKAELYVASLSASDQKPRVLIPNHEGDIRPYAWTHDGKLILYWRADEWSASLWTDGVELYAIPASGGAERKLGVAALAHNDLLDLAPEKAGNRLALTRAGGRETWSGQQIVLLDLDSGVKRNLTPPDVSALNPAWSPDGRRIACCAAPDGARLGVSVGDDDHRLLQQRKIWLLDLVGQQSPRQLTHDPQFRDEEPLWSSDGSHILFGRMGYEGNATLWLMESSGANAKQICPLSIYNSFGNSVSWFGYYGYADWRSAFDWRR